MTDSTAAARQHYSATGLTERLQSALAALAPEDQLLTVAQLAPLDQFHIRGLHATAELANAATLDESSRVIDIGSGIGGPARYLASMFDCQVTGLDLSPSFVDAATYLTHRCALANRATFLVGDALQLPFPPGSFDAVFLQHVAMNIADRDALYSGVYRVLAPGGRFITYDLVRRHDEVLYPVPWARDPAQSLLLTEDQTRAALQQAGFRTRLWRNDTRLAIEWFQATTAAPSPGGFNLGLVMGPDFRTMTANLARNLEENRLDVVSAVLVRD
jgi:SAM-dependent methyltransferase